ncbi:flagellar hook-basal body complex protein, partial [bacterium]|nr:flagellar hook-basal body complex protein [bacterium]
GIEGNGFFVVNDGARNLYTRAGNFQFDGNGRLVTANGMAVQGWTADATGVIGETTSVGDVVLDTTVISPAKATENVALAGNFDAMANPVRQVWSGSTPLIVSATSLPAVGSTDLNDLSQTAVSLVDGDTIEIGGTSFDGTPVAATFTYGAANDGTTVQDLLDAMATAFGGTVTLDAGRIVLTDTNFGESKSTITLTPGAGNTGTIDLPGFALTQQGSSPKVSTSVEVFDSLGSKHTLNVTFTKTENPREWVFAANFSGDEVIQEGNSGTITFLPDGTFEQVLYDNGESLLVFDPNNGAEAVSLNLDFENATGFSGLTLFSGLSSINVPFQDGQSKGELNNFAVDETGKIIGSFTNGRNQLIAQLALASIKNPEGLVHAGNNVYELSGSTGIPIIGKAGDEIEAATLSGTLEASNVDLAEEFAEMIIAQRAFQANARVITVSDQFLSEVTQLKR